MQDIDIKDIFNLPLRGQMAVIGIFCFLIFYLGYQWDISSLKKELISVKTQQADLKTQLQALMDNLGNVNSDIAQLPKLEELLKQWQSQLIKVENLPDALNEILKIGTTDQLEFQLFTPGSEIKDDTYPLYRRIPITTVVIGEFSQLANFISQVANMNTLIVITNLEIAKGQNKLFDKKEAEEPGYADRLTGAMSLDVYHLATKEELEKDIHVDTKKNEK
jgi:Tfp pilus assembly protein PilO